MNGRNTNTTMRGKAGAITTINTIMACELGQDPLQALCAGASSAAIEGKVCSLVQQ
jgi:hypothetical protein